MKISEIDLRGGSEIGLRPTKMQRLGEVVVLAGANGAGKTRILNVVKKTVEELPTDQQMERLRAQLQSSEERATRFESGGSGSGALESVRKSIEDLRRQIERSDRIGVSGSRTGKDIFEFVPKGTKLVSYAQYGEDGQETSAQNVARNVGVDSLEHGTLSYIVRIVRRWITTSHQDYPGTDEMQAEARSAFERLNELCEALLEAPIKWDDLQHPTLFGRRLSLGELSEGQAVLLQVVVALHAHGQRLDGLVLLLDEPESHLHPAACLDVLNRLRAANPLGQLWVATHSLSVLASVPVESIWFVERGEATWAGRSPEKVIRGLLGNEEERARLADLLSLPSVFAGNRFAAQCLLSPRVVKDGSDDPQAKLVRDHMGLKSGDASLRVLDFGAGEGRLLASLKEVWGDKRGFEESVEYFAYEPYARNQAELSARVRDLSGDHGDRVFSSREELALMTRESVDVVVICNVLHELLPQQWLELFGANSFLRPLLRTDGYVLVLEDEEMPLGEKAHRLGFLLLQRTHLCLLLGCSESSRQQVVTSESNGGRLKAHAVPRSLLGGANLASVRNALSALRETAQTNVVAIRDDSFSPENGRRHAYWSQISTNASLALAEYGDA